ncbi:MAG: hypothetical protein DWQ07_03950 [Chloroflexi bacterium]|nr:MAG: hypothetical protein DWQ07_03950 [Chloroflexota bacterium]MBL1193345.1 hypothetical protein [Chloroflexota bacterium]NOH10637.1 hypothetical protein [Chloroflexota bacterium]
MPSPLSLLIAGLIVLAATYFLWRWYDRGSLRRRSQRELTEDALKYIQIRLLEEKPPTLDSLAGVLNLARDKTVALLVNMESQGLITRTEGKLTLTEAGSERSHELIRAHRLWEHYLAEDSGYSPLEWHEQAEKREHQLTPAEMDALASKYSYPSHDPHGDPIPSTGEKLRRHAGETLSGAPVGTRGEIVHLEDEPQAIAEELDNLGLHSGMLVEVVERNDEAITLVSNGHRLQLPVMAADNIFVEANGQLVPQAQSSLKDLQRGQSGRVLAIAQQCRGAERQRFMDLGILPGTIIRAELTSPGGDPTAYLIRDALIALRADQANYIKIEPVEEE